MKQYHPHLMNKDWMTDKKKLPVEELTDGDLKAILTKEAGEQITCWCFYYETSYRDVVFLLQDGREKNNIAITLLQNGRSVNSVNLKG